MKKLVIGLLAALLVLVACGSTKAYEVSTENVVERIENKESFILYIGSKDCSACQQFAPTFEEVYNDYPDTLYSIEYTSAIAKDKETFEALEENHIQKVTGTPSVYVIKEGVVVEKRVGVLKYSELETLIERFELNK